MVELQVDLDTCEEPNMMVDVKPFQEKRMRPSKASFLIKLLDVILWIKIMLFVELQI